VAKKVVQGYSVSDIERLTGVSRKTLHAWDRTGFLSPSVQSARGTGSRRLYSFQDVVAIRVVSQLRAAGVSLQALRRVVDRVRVLAQRDHPLAETYLVSDGVDVYERRGAALLSWLRQPRQTVWAFVIDVPSVVRTVINEVARSPSSESLPRGRRGHGSVAAH
jgi:DNA-binding transcriptional MerR regulator